MLHAPLIAAASVVACTAALSAAPSTSDIVAQPPELGAVRWTRDFTEGQAASRSAGKPIFLLFQEIPGCATCRGFGGGPLTEPLMVEAIESLFIPIAIHNNKPGADETILKRFGEPAWNNPVVRLVDAEGKDIVARQEGVWTTAGLAPRMVAALDASKREAPAWLRLLAQESDTSKLETAVFAMHCFWEGEATIGAIDGVVRTKAGFVDGKEVVEVLFDPTKTSYATLLEQANGRKCATIAYVRDERQREAAKSLGANRLQVLSLPSAASAAPRSDQKHAIVDSALALLPLTPAQATKVNAAVAAGTDPTKWLSPRQQELLARMTKAIRDDAKRFAGLSRPERAEELAAYETKLRSALGG